jgi:L-fucose isomerase-like protein
LVSALPVGEFDSQTSRAEFDAITHVFTGLGAELLAGEAVADPVASRLAVEANLARTPDLLLLVPLRGLSAQTIESAGLASRAPCLIWPINGRFALPSGTLAVGALHEAGHAVELLFAPPGDPTAIESARIVLKAARALSRIQRSRIGVIGGLFPNLVSARYDPETINKRLGASFVPLPYDSIRAVMVGGDETRQAHQALTATYEIPPTDHDALATGLNLHLALKRLAQDHQLDAFAAECWTGLPKELGLNPCLGFTEDAYVLACEGDVTLCVSLLMVQYLTGNRSYVGDLYDLDLEGVMTLTHCGAPASLAREPRDVVLSRSEIALERGFETITCRPPLEPGPVTIFRFYGRNCDKLHLATGDLFGSEQSPTLAVKVRLGGSRWDFLKQCAGNHYLVVPGDIRPELTLLAGWLGITILET